VRFGAFSIYLPLLVKPAAAKLKALLWAVHQDITDIPPPPPAGLTSLQAESTIPAGFYEAAGYRVCGPRAVRIDMLERVGELIRGKGQSGKMPEHFSISPDMMSVLGCGEEDLSLILRALGFRDVTSKNEAGVETTLWHQRHKRDDRRPKAAPQGEARRDEARGEARAAGDKRRKERFAGVGAPASPRPDRRQPPAEAAANPKQGKPAPRKKDKPFVVDPDSPFAALAALKFQK
jgi:ATP-dependent RNA helicase SUPV3L1/SUV3